MVSDRLTDRLKYRSREILAALILTLAAGALVIATWSGRDDRAQAVQPVAPAGQTAQK
jgi:hypothetical protein